MSSKPISAMIETPMSLGDRDQVAIEEIPLPPPEKWDELENETPPAAPAAAVPSQPPREIAPLDFIDGKHCRRVPLTYPFRLGDAVVSEIVVHRLTVGEVGDLLDYRAPSPDNFDIYSLMTGFPAAILRGLIDTDGEDVSTACFDFLPRLFRPVRAAPPSPSTDGAA